MPKPKKGCSPTELLLFNFVSIPHTQFVDSKTSVIIDRRYRFFDNKTANLLSI